MFATLEHMGFGCSFLSKDSLLYENACARVRVNGHLSNAFEIHNGTLPGYPLSPLLYVLTLEPFLQILQFNDAIKGIHIWGTTYKVAAFADDILLYLSDPLTTLPNLLKALEEFQKMSNQKRNYDKSTALNVSRDRGPLY